MTRRASILVVDDEPGIRELLAQILADEGHNAHAVATGEAALAALAEELYDLVLLDLWLPGIGGLEVLRRLRRDGPPVPVVVISGHASASQAVEALHEGAVDFLEKPLAYDRVMVSIANALHREQLERRIAAAVVDAGEPRLTGQSAAIRELRRQILTAAPSEGRVLLTGANGTGKEVAARLLHERSPRRDGPFVAVNCAAIPSELIESELFGHLKGAFTGAVEAKRGRFELADGGTLLLDEIGDMSQLTQSKVLRVLQEQRFTRLGGSREVTVDVRVVAATNKDLEEAIAGGSFRSDLYYRLAVVPIRLPTLAERREDIPALVDEFVAAAVARRGVPPRRFSAAALERLMAHHWPGNVRELKNVVERLMIMVDEPEIRLEHLAFLTSSVPVKPDLGSLGPLREARAEFERRYIVAALDRCGGNVSRTARVLGLERSHLHRKLRQLKVTTR